MSGRIYTIKRISAAKKTNFFTADMYNEAAMSIDKVSAYDGEGHGIKISTNSKESLIAVRNIIEDLWKRNGNITPKSHRTFDAVAHTELYKFGTGKEAKQKRDKAMQIAQKFAMPDAISELSEFGTDGSVTTGEGLKTLVEVVVKDNPDDPDNPLVDPLKDDRTVGKGGKTYKGSDDDSNTDIEIPWMRYLLIGGIALVAIVIAIMYFKKK